MQIGSAVALYFVIWWLTLFAVLPAGAWRFGLGISAPFGSKTDYEAGWRGRFQRIR